MGNAFTNFLSLKGQKIIKTFDHATKLYVDDTYAKSPKAGFIYFVGFNINKNAVNDEEWSQKYADDVGLLVKRTDLPKFNIATDTLNQYNRKTVVQTKLTYNPITIEFHDDNTNITNKLWINYYQHYYSDSTYGGSIKGRARRDERSPAWGDTKYGLEDNKYGRWAPKQRTDPFFSTIDLYVLHQQNYTQFTLINPKITEWSHDNVDQNETNKILRNRMTIAYENVFYNQGVVGESEPEGFDTFYDREYSPYSAYETPLSKAIRKGAKELNSKVGGGFGDIFERGLKSLPLPNIPGINSALPNFGPLKNGLESGLTNAALSLTSSLFKNSGKASDVISNSIGQVFNSPGGAGITVFKGFNSGNNDTTPARQIDTGDYGGSI